MVAYPERLSLAQLPTPLQPLERLSAELGGPRIWVKRDDLTGCAASGNKIRKLEFTLARVLGEGADTLITCGGIQSNHCRATAILGAQLGLKVHLILRDEGEQSALPDGNLLLDYLAGAEVSIYLRDDFQRRLPALFQHWIDHYLDTGRKPYPIPTGASDGHGVWGYVRCAEELRADFDRVGIAPGAIVHATGSGGTQAGLTAGAHLHCLGARVIGIAVCDDAAWFERKVRADLVHWQQHYGIDIDIDQLAIEVNDQYIGPGYGQATAAVFATIKTLARVEGLILDPVYTGKGFHGLMEEIRRGSFRDMADIVFVHTGGIFGLFAQRSQLALG